MVGAVLDPVEVGLVVDDVGVGSCRRRCLHGAGQLLLLLLLVVLVERAPERGPRVARALHPAEARLLDGVRDLKYKTSSVRSHVMPESSRANIYCLVCPNVRAHLSDRRTKKSVIFFCFSLQNFHPFFLLRRAQNAKKEPSKNRYIE